MRKAKKTSKPKATTPEKAIQFRLNWMNSRLDEGFRVLANAAAATQDVVLQQRGPWHAAVQQEIQAFFAGHAALAKENRDAMKACANTMDILVRILEGMERPRKKKGKA